MTNTFAGLPEGAEMSVGDDRFAISYVGGDGNDVTLTCLPHEPTSFEIVEGDHQSTTVNTAFATLLRARVLDEDSNPMEGVEVTFSAPADGASGAFSGSTTVLTNSEGYAKAPAFTANTVAGAYTVTAAAAGLDDLSFSFTNNPGPLTSLTAAAGDGQSALVNTTFVAKLKALCRDAYGNAISGVDVTFTPPAGGASGAFGGSSTVTSDAGGYAEAPAFTANSVSGPYGVTAAAGNVTTSFALTNTAASAAPQITSEDATTFVEGSAGSFTVTANGRPVPSLSAAGPLPAGVTFIDNGDGTATIAGTPAAGTHGDYDITVTAANGVGVDATQAFALQVNSGLPPVTTVQGVPARWVRRAVELTFHAVPGAGSAPLACTEYRLGPGAWTRGSSVRITRQGATKVWYRSVDTAGHVEPAQQCTVRIDNVAPVVTDYGHPVAWQGSKARFSFRVNDTAARMVDAKLAITRYGQPVIQYPLGLRETGKRLVASVTCRLGTGTWSWRIVAHDQAGARGVGSWHRLEVYPNR